MQIKNIKKPGFKVFFDKIGNTKRVTIIETTKPDNIYKILEELARTHHKHCFNISPDLKTWVFSTGNIMAFLNLYECCHKIGRDL